MLSKNVDEEELLLQKRARRRLVGAIVLVMISVIILPVIFDEPQLEDEKREITINLPAPSGKSNENSSIHPSDKESIKNNVSIEGFQHPPELQRRSDDSGDTIGMPSEQKRIPIPGIKPRISQLAESRGAGVAAMTKNTTETVVSAPDAAKGFVVQLGAFSDQWKAKQHQQKLLSDGFKVYTEMLKVENKEVTRVRVGPFTTRSAAEAELKKIKKIGLDGVVVPR